MEHLMAEKRLAQRDEVVRSFDRYVVQVTPADTNDSIDRAPVNAQRLARACAADLLLRAHGLVRRLHTRSAIPTAVTQDDESLTNPVWPRKNQKTVDGQALRRRAELESEGHQAKNLHNRQNPHQHRGKPSHQ
eukprot:6186626-Pleurochrysis_carterae.AAC.1